MKFLRELICDKNSLNEKTFVGLCAFFLIAITLVVDLITGWMGRELPIHEFIFDGIMVIVIGAFFGTSLDKWINKKSEKKKEENNQTTDSEQI